MAKNERQIVVDTRPRSEGELQELFQAACAAVESHSYTNLGKDWYELSPSGEEFIIELEDGNALLLTNERAETIIRDIASWV